MGWHGAMATPWATICQLFSPLGDLFAVFYYCFAFATEERFPEISVKLNFGLCSIPERSTFSLRHIIHLIVIA